MSYFVAIYSSLTIRQEDLCHTPWGKSVAKIPDQKKPVVFYAIELLTNNFTVSSISYWLLLFLKQIIN